MSSADHPEPSPDVNPADQPNDPAAADFPTSGRLIGVDYGTVRIGISICDPLRILVSPLEIRQVGGRDADGVYFAQLAKRERAAGFVVGLPIHCDGGESAKSVESRSFARWLTKVTGLPVRLFDERFTSSAAQNLVSEAPGGSHFAGKSPRSRKKKAMRERRIDAVAAQVLLESFLEAARYRRDTPGFAPNSMAAGDRSLES